MQNNKSIKTSKEILLEFFFKYLNIYFIRKQLLIFVERFVNFFYKIMNAYSKNHDFRWK